MIDKRWGDKGKTWVKNLEGYDFYNRWCYSTHMETALISKIVVDSGVQIGCSNNILYINTSVILCMHE